MQKVSTKFIKCTAKNFICFLSLILIEILTIQMLEYLYKSGDKVDNEFEMIH